MDGAAVEKKASNKVIMSNRFVSKTSAILHAKSVSNEDFMNKKNIPITHPMPSSEERSAF